MVYYFKDAHNLNLMDDFEFPVANEKEMRGDWVARLWSIAYFYETENGDLIFHHPHILFYKNKKQAIANITRFNTTGLVEILVCHTIDRYRFEWIDFYKVVVLDNGFCKTKKLKKKHLYFKKGKFVDDEHKIIEVDYDKYQSAKCTIVRKRAVAGEYGAINRFRIIQRDRLDVFHDRLDYFGIKDGNGKTDDKEYKEDRYLDLLNDLYQEVFLKASDVFDETGGAIILDAYNCSNKLVHKYFSKSDFEKVRTILAKYIEPEFIPVFLSDGKDAKKEDWWIPLTFIQKDEDKN